MLLLAKIHKKKKIYKSEQAYLKNKSFLQTTNTKTLQKKRGGLVISLIIRSKGDSKVFQRPSQPTPRTQALPAPLHLGILDHHPSPLSPREHLEKALGPEPKHS
jgi:hypothetical protein